MSRRCFPCAGTGWIRSGSGLRNGTPGTAQGPGRQPFSALTVRTPTAAHPTPAWVFLTYAPRRGDALPAVTYHQPGTCFSTTARRGQISRPTVCAGPGKNDLRGQVLRGHRRPPRSRFALRTRRRSACGRFSAFFSPRAFGIDVPSGHRSRHFRGPWPRRFTVCSGRTPFNLRRTLAAAAGLPSGRNRGPRGGADGFFYGSGPFGKARTLPSLKLIEMKGNYPQVNTGQRPDRRTCGKHDYGVWLDLWGRSRRSPLALAAPAFTTNRAKTAVRWPHARTGHIPF